MKAVILNEFGSADVLQYVECPIPSISSGEVLIRTTYTSVNFADIKNRTGNKAKANFPMILGLDVAGVVEKVFDESSMFKKRRSCYCISEKWSLCGICSGKGAASISYP